VTDLSPSQRISAGLAVELSRRELVTRAGLWAALAALATQILSTPAEAQEATPVDPAHLQELLDLSSTLCGGGTFNPDRGAMLLRFFRDDPELAAGLDELLASPPVDGESLGSERAQTAAQAILLYWYAGSLRDAPVPDRSTAYYQLTAWQAMYTPSWAVCKVFGGWADPPGSDPLVPAHP
jgi:hypothetical protein